MAPLASILFDEGIVNVDQASSPLVSRSASCRRPIYVQWILRDVRFAKPCLLSIGPNSSAIDEPNCVHLAPQALETNGTSVGTAFANAVPSSTQLASTLSTRIASLIECQSIDTEEVQLMSLSLEQIDAYIDA